jgi:hypothetical protein
MVGGELDRGGDSMPGPLLPRALLSLLPALAVACKGVAPWINSWMSPPSWLPVASCEHAGGAAVSAPSATCWKSLRRLGASGLLQLVNSPCPAGADSGTVRWARLLLYELT